MTKQKKISLAEIVLISLTTLSIDGIAIVADIAGADIGWLIQIPSWLVLTFFFTIKGAKVTSSITQRFIIPIGVQLLPDWIAPAQLTATFLVTAYMENHPEKFGVITKTTSAISGKPSALGTKQ
jgi:hypothetical protein